MTDWISQFTENISAYVDLPDKLFEFAFPIGSIWIIAETLITIVLARKIFKFTVGI